MKVDKVAVGYERKHNLGDYNSVTAEVSLWADLEDGDDPQAVIAELQEMAREDVKRELLRVTQKKKPIQTSNSRKS